MGLIKTFIANKVVKHSSIYILSSAINSSIPFLLLPIMTACLSPADYGIIAMFQVIIGFLVPLIGINIDGAISIEYYLKTHANLGNYIGNCLILSLTSFLLFLILGLCFGKIFSVFFEIPSFWINVAIIQTFLTIIYTVLLTLWQVSQNPIKYGIFTLGISILNSGLSIWLVYHLNMNYTGRLGANFGAVVLFSAIAFIFLIKNFNLTFTLNHKLSMDILKYGIPLIPHAIGGWALSLIDRLFLGKIVGLDEVGKYSVAFQIASILGFITLGINQSFAPWLYGKLSSNKDYPKKQIVKFTYLCILGLIFLTIFGILLLPLIKTIFINKRFTGIDTYFNILILGFLVQGIYYLFVCYIFYVKKTKILAKISLIVILTKIPLTYFLVKNFDGVGAAWAYTLTYTLFAGLVIFSANKVYPMPWNLLKLTQNVA